MSTNVQPNVAIILTPDSVTVQYGGQTHTVHKSDPRYEKIKLAYKEKRKQDIPSIIASPIEQIAANSDGKIDAENGVLRVEIDGVKRVVPTRLASRILEHQRDDLPTEGLIAFTKNLLLNPSYHSVQQLFDFLENNKHPITDDGRFVAYKKVSPEFKDLYSRKFDNSPGQVVKVPRNEVNDDPEQTCSNGLHVAAMEYARDHYGSSFDPIVEVLVNPRDVVSVPTDYNRQKMRTCEYEVIGVVTQPTTDKYRVTRPSASSAPASTSAPNDTTIASPPPVQANHDDPDDSGEVEQDDDQLEGQLPLKQYCSSCGVSLENVEDGNDEHEWNCAQEGIGADAIADYTRLQLEFGEATAVHAVADKYGSEVAERLPNSGDYL